jgi:hypothetical protein
MDDFLNYADGRIDPDHKLSDVGNLGYEVSVA